MSLRPIEVKDRRSPEIWTGRFHGLMDDGEFALIENDVGELVPVCLSSFKLRFLDRNSEWAGCSFKQLTEISAAQNAIDGDPKNPF